MQGQLKCLEGSQGPQNPGRTISRKKNVLIFLKIIGPVTPLLVLNPFEIMNMVSTELLLARAVFARSIKVSGGQPGAPKSRENDFPKKKKRPDFLKFIGLVKPLWVLYPSDIMYMDSTESLLVRAAFAKSIKVLGLQPGTPKSREHDFPKKNGLIFEIHRTSDNSISSVALQNHAYGLYKTFTSQSIVCKVN